MSDGHVKGSRTFVSLFSGCGGLDLGFVNAGFRCVGAFDAEPEVLATYRHNLGTPAHNCDLSGPFLPEKLTADLVVAGPPCQGFSTAGKRDLNDPRNSLLISATQIALQIRPAVFVLENVAGATAGEHRIFWNRVEAMLKNSNYKVVTLTCRASTLGLAQLRTRLVLIAWNTGRSPTLTLPVLPSQRLRDVLRGVESARDHRPKYLDPKSALAKVARRIGPGQKLCNVRLGATAIHTWDIPEIFGLVTKTERQALSAIALLRRRERIRDYGDADPVRRSSVLKLMGRDISQELDALVNKGYLKKIGRRFDLTHTFNGKFRRLQWDEPAFTVDTRFGDPRYFLHPAEQRGFTVREAARVQGFPDSFEFFGTERQQYRMIGNAVPPPMANTVANLVNEGIFS
jgi:DNA (cytosine-5)-methyltransferase 1